jgi:hypothetical protein
VVKDLLEEVPGYQGFETYSVPAVVGVLTFACVPSAAGGPFLSLLLLLPLLFFLSQLLLLSLPTLVTPLLLASLLILTSPVLLAFLLLLAFLPTVVGMET